MTTLLDSVYTEISFIRRHIERQNKIYCRDLGSEYAIAFLNYIETINTQKGLDEAKSEQIAVFAILALSISGGILLTKYFSALTAKELAAKAVNEIAVRSIIKLKSEKAWKSLLWMNKENSAAGLILGTAWDTYFPLLSEKVKSQIKDIATQVNIPKGIIKDVNDKRKRPIVFQNILFNLATSSADAIDATIYYFYKKKQTEILKKLLIESPYLTSETKKVKKYYTI